MPPRTLEEIRAANEHHYGPPVEARAYAEGHGAMFCEDCYGVFEQSPEEDDPGHVCPGRS